MPGQTDTAEFAVKTIDLDLPALAGTFSRRLHRAGVPVTAERAARFAQALTVVKPIARRRLYWTARAVFVSDQAQLRAFDAVFRSVFAGDSVEEGDSADDEVRTSVPAPADDREGSERSEGSVATDAPAIASGAAERHERPEPELREVEVPLAPSDEEVLRGKRFDALEAHELARLYRLMARLRLATPLRRTRRAERCQRGNRIDLRRTLRGSIRTAGDPIRLRHRRRRVVPRRLVLLCDISGSMEPYARTYLQFLACAAGSRGVAEAFVFATRLTRVTRALASRSPERALQNAAAAAPDWSSGTRIGDALKAFNDGYGRRGLARGAVVVILSDGWERGDPALVGTEMERLARLAYRIVWVNPRAGAEGFAPRAGGMVAAIAHCDALVSGHNLEALDEVVEAIGLARADGGLGAARWGPQSPPAEPEEEPWESATPVPGSSVAMPSGYGPSRGRTTPGWGLDGS